MSVPTLFGIPNCDTVRKARKWLESQGITHDFVDLRDNTPAASQIAVWLETLGADRLINRRSTTYKQLDAVQRASLDGDQAIALLREHPTLIKRPVLALKNHLSVGFSEQEYTELFNV
jgi:Spx/MgsR family transcriptional regulator